MTSFQFTIPNENSNLLDSKGDSYYVKQVYDPNEISDQLKVCKQAAFNQDAFYIFDHFDTYFSVIENAENLTANTLLRSFDLLFFTSEKLEKSLSNFLNNSDGINESDRNSYANLTKMIFFAYIGTVKAIDRIILKAQSESGQLKRSKKICVEGFDGSDWEDKKFSFFVQIYNIIQLPLDKLWNPPVAEEDFVNMFCDICYRTLELPYSKEKKLCDTIFQILGTAIKRYNHAIIFPVKILQILRSDKAENAINAIAGGIYLLHDEFGLQSVFTVLVNDIIEMLRGESGDLLAAKSIGIFLTELANVSSNLIIPHLPILAEELLNCESYSLRNCILQIIGDVIIKELTSEELSDELKETRDDFLEDLLNHMNDIHANVRSKVLQIWTHMKEQNSVPLAFQHKVLKAGVERLEDKTIPVRKNAVILLKSFLENNPFAAKLTLEELIKKHEEETVKMEKLRDEMAEENKKVAELDKKWETIIPELMPALEETVRENVDKPHFNSNQKDYETLVSEITTLLVEKKYNEVVKLVIEADHVAGNDELRNQLKFEEICVYLMALLKSYLFISHGSKNINEEFITQENAIRFLKDSIEFSKIINEAVPKIQNMLMSKSNTDVFEAVDFFTTAFLFGIKGTEDGMKNMLYLIWSGDKEKRDAVINAYKKILFTTDLQGRAHAIKVVKNLSSFIENLTHGQYSAMEVLIKEWVESDDIDPMVIQALYERFTMKLEDTTENESRLALQILIAASSTKSSISSSNVEIIENIGFGKTGLKDPRVFVCCLRLISNSVPSHLRSKFYKRYDQQNASTVDKILNLFKKFFFFPKIKDFDDIATRTIEFFYSLCQSPDIICQNLIIDIHKKMKEISTNFQPVSSTQTLPLSPSSQPKQSKVLPTFLLTRFIFLVGFITMKEMIFLDVDVYNNMKFREELREMKNNMKKKIHKRRTLHLEMSASESLKRLSGSAAEPQQEPDEDLVGAIAEDNIAELINYICEEELLYSENGILPKIIPAIVEICKYPTKYNDELLQQASSLCLIRFMAVSSKFCEKYMPFVMNILQQTENIKIKCNIIVGLSDLTFRFPNIIEPWTGLIFSTLNETNDELRLTAVKMISHLILNEMIRVKSQISDLAICIVDKNEEIKHITQQFFKELANKPNTLYNVIPDIISRLSDTSLNLEEGKYRIIMKYILGLIQKDRQIESLVDKLCLRFKVTYEERQWRDIAYCLSLLNYSEKSIKKLTDNIQYFKDKVQIDEVYQSFKMVVTNISKLAKQELKAAATEFDNRLNECLQVENGDSKESPTATKSNTTSTTKINRGGLQKKVTFGKRGRKPLEKKPITTSSEESNSSSSSDEEDDASPPLPPPQQQKNRKTKVNEQLESSDDDSPILKRGRRGRKGNPKRK